MLCFCLKELHPAPQGHGSALNTDRQGPYPGVCSGSQLHSHMVSGRNYIFTYAFSLGEPHSSVRLLQPHYPPCSSTPHHHCPPHSKWSGAAHFSVCCTWCRTACGAQHRLSGAGGQLGTDRGNCICICRPLTTRQMAISFTFYFQPAKRREGTEIVELGLKIWFGPN